MSIQKAQIIFVGRQELVDLLRGMLASSFESLGWAIWDLSDVSALDRLDDSPIPRAIIAYSYNDNLAENLNALKNPLPFTIFIQGLTTDPTPNKNVTVVHSSMIALLNFFKLIREGLNLEIT